MGPYLPSPPYKYYVTVDVLIDEEGHQEPLALWWMKKRYEIDKVLSVTETYSKAGGCGIRYTCRIHGEIRQLFLERNRWFLESDVWVEPGQDPGRR